MAAKKKLPSFDGLTDYDFALFTREKWSSPNYDAGRLKVKRKLAAIGKHVEAGFKDEGIQLVHKTSVHNPCRYNSNRVRMLKVYFARSKAARKPIKDILGETLAKDLDPHYCNTQLWLKVRADCAEMSVSVHPAAWWDASNVAKICESREGRAALAEELDPLPDYHLQVADFVSHECHGLRHDSLQRIMKHYIPGDHWLHVFRRFGAEEVVELGPDFLEVARTEFARLVPVYDMLAWTP